MSVPAPTVAVLLPQVAMGPIAATAVAANGLGQTAALLASAAVAPPITKAALDMVV